MVYYTFNLKNFYFEISKVFNIGLQRYKVYKKTRDSIPLSYLFIFVVNMMNEKKQLYVSFNTVYNTENI